MHKMGRHQAVMIGYVKKIRLSVYSQGSKLECIRISDGSVFGLWFRPFKLEHVLILSPDCILIST